MRSALMLLLIMSVLAGFCRLVCAAESDETNPSPKNARRIIALKKQVLQLSSREVVTVRLVNKRKVAGILVSVSDAGITVLRFGRKTLDQPDSQMIPFEQVKGISRQTSSARRVAFVWGVGCGILGPVGWFALALGGTE